MIFKHRLGGHCLGGSVHSRRARHTSDYATFLGHWGHAGHRDEAQ